MISEDRDPTIEAMRAGVDYRFRISCRKLIFTVRPLSIDEENQVIERVSEYMDGLPPTARTSLKESTTLAKEYLKLASTPEPGNGTQAIWDSTLSKMTAAEVNHLYRQYVQACERVNPSLETMPSDEVKSLIEKLKKKAEGEIDSTLIELSFLQLINICRALIQGG